MCVSICYYLSAKLGIDRLRFRSWVFSKMHLLLAYLFKTTYTTESGRFYANVMEHNKDVGIITHFDTYGTVFMYYVRPKVSFGLKLHILRMVYRVNYFDEHFSHKVKNIVVYGLELPDQLRLLQWMYPNLSFTEDASKSSSLRTPVGMGGLGSKPG